MSHDPPATPSFYSSAFLLLSRPLLQRNRNRAQHVAGGSRLARPDFKLPRRLLHEHLNSRNHANALAPRHLEQVGLDRVIHHVEDDASLNLVVLEHRVTSVPHPYRSRVDDHVECDFAEVGALNRPSLRLASQLLAFYRSAVQDPDLCAAFFESKNSGPGRSSRAQHEHFRAIDRNALLQRTNHTRDIGIESIELAFLSANDSVARAGLRRVRVRVIEMGQDGLLVGHGDAESMQRNVAHTAHQILQRLGVERKIDAINILAAERRVHDDWRKRMPDGIARNSIDSSGGVDLIDAIDAAQIARADL